MAARTKRLTAHLLKSDDNRCSTTDISKKHIAQVFKTLSITNWVLGHLGNQGKRNDDNTGKETALRSFLP